MWTKLSVKIDVMLLLNVCVHLIIFINLNVNCQEENYPTQEYQYSSHVVNKKLYKLGEFNEKCRATRDCRPFGYVCRDNKTCQCDFMYIPDSNKKTCVGGVNQRCIYDEHCIEGAFCMNQAICKCKESSPIELEDGLVCSGESTLEHFGPVYVIILLNMFIL